MKRYAALLAILLVAVPMAAMAGMNEGGTLLVSTGVWTKTVACTTLGVTACDQLTPTNTTAPGANNYVAVYIGREPDPLTVAGIDFGIDYNADAVYSPVWNKCGDLEIPTDGSTAPAWPTPGSGDSMIWNYDQTGNVILVGWFKVTTYTGYGAMRFCATIHPLDGVALVVDPTGTQDVLRGPACGSFDGVDYGGNPDCHYGTAVQDATWGSIKTLYQN